MVTHQRAVEVDGVIDLLRADGLSIERLNLCQYPENSIYSWSPHRGMKSSSIENLLSAKVGRFHNPGHYTISRSLEGHARELAFRECQGFWYGVTSSANINWLTPPASLHQASHKLSQLSQALDLGFPIPPTLISNDKEVSISGQPAGGSCAALRESPQRFPQAATAPGRQNRSCVHWSGSCQSGAGSSRFPCSRRRYRH